MTAQLARHKWLILATIVVLIPLLVPGSVVPMVDSVSHLDLAVHLSLFFLWSLALAHDLPAVAQRPWLAIPATLGFALLSETLQLYASDRTFDLLDVVADVVGSLVAVIVLVAWRGGQ